ncbi:solute carrier family 12 member 2-like isoform X2 [Bolinopsis microptera]|uniref:solute carrier family 12 member 2-like isoform X2 n=1 Tax=Bolinopsis microptera TaxID=2820187 RepID=UPI00307A8BAD
MPDHLTVPVSTVHQNNGAVSRFKVNFVDQGDQGRKGSEGDTHERSDTVNSHSHTHDSATHRSTFQYKNFDTLDFVPKTAFYRNTQQDGTHRPTMAEMRAGKRMPAAETPKIKTELGDGPSALKLGWIQGVLVRCLLNIWGVMLFIRISWVVGNAGVACGLGVVLLSAVVTSVTSISLAAICTNGEVKGGGAYYLISRSLGPEFGGAIGIVFSIANAIAVAMYIVGFAETLCEVLRVEAGFTIFGDDPSLYQHDMRIWGLVTLVLLFGISMAGMAWESKAQIVLLFLLMAAMINFIVGTFIRSDAKTAEGFYGYNVEILKFNMMPHYQEGENFFTVFSVFFPAATGIMAGANISGDLKNPSEAIPKGTLIAVILSTITYCIFALQAGATTILGATGNISQMAEFPSNLTAASQCIFDGELMLEGDCPYGLLNSFSAMSMMSGYKHIITIGIFAATLSSALASLVSAPKVFQAVCKDKLFPYIGWFAKGYGSNNEPWRAYALALLIAAAFVCIAELNAIAPIITNFFLISYTLINYSCFEASFSNSPGWRPSYKYYNTWVSLFGSLLCAAVMFITSWWTALITVVIIYALYRYIQYRKPAVNWGSSKQALKYNYALDLIHEVSGLSYHVKNFRPQFLVLTGAPSSRPRLVNLMSDISKGYGVMICGHIIRNKYKVDQYMSENHLLIANKIKAFHVPVAAPSFRIGVKNLLQTNGLGVIKANTLILGYKHSWNEQTAEQVEEYVGIIKDAFDHHFAVGVLRNSSKLDVKNLPEDDTTLFDETGDGLVSTAQSKDNLEPEEGAATKDSKPSSVNESLDKKSQKSGNEDLEMAVVDPESPSSDTSFDNHRFTDLKPKGTIDVYWLSDDGGLSILIPYLLSQSKYWSQTSLRVFAYGKAGEMGHEKVRMATLLHKFRIEFASVEIVVGLDDEPSQESIDDYMKYKPAEEAEQIDAKTKQYIRMGELLRDKTTEDTQLIVLTLPVPRDSTPPQKYMSWLEVMSNNLPPILMLRGNQQDALTFYC